MTCPHCWADARDLGGYFECTLCGYGWSFRPIRPVPIFR